MAICRPAPRLVGELLAATAALTACTNDHVQLASPSLPVPPPAVSAIDRTVTVRWQLADSFDVLPGGTCAGRGENRGIRNGARMHLQGDTTGFVDETRATATFERRALSAGEARGDDGLYCVLRAVFAPVLPDPDGYSIKIPGTPIKWDHVGASGHTPFGHPNLPPGFGSINLGSQLCPNLLDPPEKECPEWVG